MTGGIIKLRNIESIRAICFVSGHTTSETSLARTIYMESREDVPLWYGGLISISPSWIMAGMC